MRKGLMVMAAFGLWASAAAAQGAADVREGRALARRVCARCHAVENTIAPSPDARAPTFRSIANTPGMQDAALYGAIRTPHGGMPVLLPDAEDVAHVTAYLRSLRGRE